MTFLTNMVYWVILFFENKVRFMDYRKHNKSLDEALQKFLDDDAPIDDVNLKYDDAIDTLWFVIDLEDEYGTLMVEIGECGNAAYVYIVDGSIFHDSIPSAPLLYVLNTMIDDYFGDVASSC